MILDSGDETFATLTAYAAREQLTGASVTALGAFDHATVGWFDLTARQYRDIRSRNNAKC
jgi:hypothetical protein